MILVIEQPKLNQKVNLQSLTLIEFSKCSQMKHSIQNPDFCDINETINDFITKQILKFESFLVKRDLKIVFDKKMTVLFQSELRFILSIFHLKRFLMFKMEHFCKRGYIFSLKV